MPTPAYGSFSYPVKDESYVLVINSYVDGERWSGNLLNMISKFATPEEYTLRIDQQAEGSVRTYVMREDKCVIFSFSFEGDPATSTLGTQPGGLSRQTIETMEPATLVRIPRARMDELFAGNAELADWGRRMAEEQLRRHEDYFADYAWRGKREQYGRMLREYPQLLQRIALKDLAAYLFLTPQSLSRIRAGVK